MKKLIILFIFIIPLLSFSQQYQCSWAQSFGGTNGPEKAIDAAVDNNGNIYVAGTMESQQVLLGRGIYTNAGQIDMLVVKYNAAGVFQWVKQFGNTNQDLITGIDIDTNNNIYITGHYKSQTIMFDTIELVSQGASDLFLAKLSSSGDVLWAKSVGGNANDIANAVTIDPNGDVIITGQFESSSLSFGTTTLNRSVGQSDIFITRYAANGNVLWAKQSAVDLSLSYAKANDVLVDGSGKIAIAGTFGDDGFGSNGTSYLRFGNDTVANRHTYTYAGVTDYYPTALVASFDNNGNFINAYSDSAYYEALSLTSDENNNYYASIFIEGGIMISLPYAAFSLIKINKQFELAWRKDPGGGYNISTGIASDDNSNILAAGFYTSPELPFETDTIIVQNFGQHHYHEMFLVKYDTLGNEDWVTSFGGTMSDKAQGIFPIDGDNIYVIGNYESDTVKLNNSILTNESDTGSYHVHVMDNWLWRHSNAFVAKFSSVVTSVAVIPDKPIVNIYPNPGSGLFSVEGKGIKQIEVFNFHGQLIESTRVENTYDHTNINTVDISYTASGIYFVKVLTQEGIAINKLIKE